MTMTEPELKDGRVVGIAGPVIDVTRIKVRGWETVLRTHDQQRSGMLLLRPKGEDVGDLVVIGAGEQKVAPLVSSRQVSLAARSQSVMPPAQAVPGAARRSDAYLVGDRRCGCCWQSVRRFGGQAGLYVPVIVRCSGCTVRGHCRSLPGILERK